MAYRLAVFDMDGTILNTLEDLSDSLNFALKAFGYPEHTLSQVRNYVGNGIKKLVERGMPKDADEAAFNTVYEAFRAYYGAHSTVKTRPYEGVTELLQKLKASGIKLAVVSNKPDAAVQQLCREYFPDLFDAAAGERTDIKRKPAPDSVYAVLTHLNIEKSDAVYIGDSEVDIETALNSGLDCISVDWGFRDADFLSTHGAELIVSTPEGVLNYILS